MDACSDTQTRRPGALDFVVMETPRKLRTALVLASIAALSACSGCASRGAADPVAQPAAVTPGARSVAHATEPAAAHKGSASLPVPVAPRAMGVGVAHLSWARPSKLDYGREAASDPVVGYRIYAGPRPDALQLEAQVTDPRTTHYVMHRLPKGRYWFTVTSYTRLGIESDRPPPVAKLVR